ncbi:MAG: hypothetical protein ACI4B9_01225 [Eggerthellaceae bacterium]
MDVEALKCPACCALLSIDNATGSAVCEFCGTSFSREELFPTEIAADPMKDGVSAAFSGPMPIEPQAIDSLPCECPEHEDMVIPFRVTKEQAIQGFKEYYAGSKLLPKAFVKALDNQEIEQVFYPVWVFDVRVEGSQDFDCKTIRIWNDRGSDCKEAKYYRSRRRGSIRLTKVPIPGTTKLRKEKAKRLEPYNLFEAQPFSQGAVRGANVEPFSVDHRLAASQVEELGKNVLTAKFHESLKQFYRIDGKPLDARVLEESSYSVLVPIWRLKFEHLGKYFLYMNGQTGAIAGEVPPNNAKMYLSCIAAFTGVVAAGVAFALALFG